MRGPDSKRLWVHFKQASQATRAERLHAGGTALTPEEKATLWVLQCSPLLAPERRRTLIALAVGLLLCILAINATMGCLADKSVYGESWRFYAPKMLGLGVFTWALVMLRFWLGLWWNAKLSDIFANGIFFAVFALLHVYAFMHVGLYVDNAYFSGYSAIVRRLAVPSSVSSASGISAWLDKFALDWIPETLDPWTWTPHPGWAAFGPPELWTARIARRESCEYIGFSVGTCSPELNSASATEETGPWSPLPSQGLVLEHHSGEFESSRGDTLFKPKWSGKLGKYTLGRGYRLFLTDPVVSEWSIAQGGWANRSAFRSTLAQLNESSYIDDQTRVVYLSWMLNSQTLKQWLSVRVVFEISGATGRIEVTPDILQGKVPWCEFEDPDTNAQWGQEVGKMIERYMRLGIRPFCDSSESCGDILEQIGTPPFFCHNVPDSTVYPLALGEILASYGVPGLTDGKWRIVITEAPVVLLLFTWAFTLFLLVDDLVELFVTRLAYLQKAGNYLDVITMFLVFTVWLGEVQVQSSVPSDGNSWELLVHRQALEHSRLGMAIFVWWFRLLNLVSRLHPRLRVLLLTVWDAVPDLFFFCVIFGLLLLSFTMTFHLWLGTRRENYTTIPTTFLTLFKGLVGDVDFSDFEGSVTAAVGYMVYATLSVLIMVNVFIAIVSESFNRAQERTAAKSRSRQAEASAVEAWVLEPPSTKEELAVGAVLKVAIWGAHDLPPSDANLMSDPYAVCGLSSEDECSPAPRKKKHSAEVTIVVDGEEVTFPAVPVKTEIVYNSLAPVWNAKARFLFPIAKVAQCSSLRLYVKVMDHDALTTDDLLGEGSIPVPLLVGPDAARTSLLNPDIHPMPSLTRQEVQLLHPVRSGSVSISALLHVPAASDGIPAKHDVASPFRVHPLGAHNCRAGPRKSADKEDAPPPPPQMPGMLDDADEKRVAGRESAGSPGPGLV